MGIITKEAIFLFDKDGVVVVTDIEGEKVMRAEFVYDGKNCAILKRDAEFFALQNIAPMIREKIKNSKYVTIVEKSGNDIRSYEVKVHLVDDMGINDTWDQYADNIMNKLREKMSPAEFDKFLATSEEVVKSLEEE